MERKIIAINGTIGSGKDTFSKMFIENGYHRVSFAESLKDSVSVIFGWDREMLEGNTEESRKVRETVDEYWSSVLGKEITPRWVLQNFGTDVLRKHFHDNIWVFSLQKRIMNTNSDKIIITDCRFPNELQMIRSNNGVVIEVQRDVPHWYDFCFQYNLAMKDPSTADPHYQLMTPTDLFGIHSSEYAWIGLNNPDYIVQNDGTKEDLERKALDIIAKL